MRKQAGDILRRGAVIPAVPLALDAGRRFDERRQRALIKYYLNAGAEGIAVAVHSTQFEIRLPEINLFHTVVGTVLDEAALFEARHDRAVIKIVGVCGRAEQAVAEANFARETGADAALLSPGGLADLSEADMLERTRLVAAVMPVVGFYLQPAVGGRVFSADYWRRLADIDGVAAIKCAPFNRYQTLELVRGVALSERRDEIALYTGNDDNILLDLITAYEVDVGGRKVEKRFVGGLLGHWAVWTKSTVDLFERLREYHDGRDVPAELLTLNAKITDANAAFFDAANNYAGCIPGIHEVLRRQGLMAGIWCISDHEKLSPGQAEELDRVCAMYPDLTDDVFIRVNIANWAKFD